MKMKGRTRKSIRNSIVSILYSCITIVVTFIVQSFFIKILGSEYNGVKGLFQNLLSMLSVVELGFGSAIVYNLYKPIYEKNISQIKTIVFFYKKVYRIIALIIFSLGIILTFFLPLIIGKTSITENMYLIFMLFLINSVISYLLSYKRSVLYADQRNYIINIVELTSNIFKGAIQILILIYTRNFVLYLLIQILMTIISNLIIIFVVNKNYPFLENEKNNDEIDDATKRNIVNKVKGLLFHKIGEFFITGTDNILISISKNLGIVYVGYYSNYNMIISNVALIFSTMLNSVTASIGNLLVDKASNGVKKIQTYKTMVLINSWLYCFGMIAIFCLMETFIKIWIGEEYLLSNFVLFVLVMNFYINGMKRTSNSFKEAAGIFYEDRFVPLIESAVNIVFSIVFMHFFGLAGVFLGTIVSSLVLLLYSYPKYVYKRVLNDKIVNYFKLYLFYFVITMIVFAITLLVNTFIICDNIFVQFVLKAVVCAILPNALFVLFAFKRSEFANFKTILVSMKKSNK